MVGMVGVYVLLEMTVWDVSFVGQLFTEDGASDCGL